MDKLTPHGYSLNKGKQEMERNWAEEFPLLATSVDYKKVFLLVSFQAKSLVPRRFTCWVVTCCASLWLIATWWPPRLCVIVALPFITYCHCPRLASPTLSITAFVSALGSTFQRTWVSQRPNFLATAYPPDSRVCVPIFLAQSPHSAAWWAGPVLFPPAGLCTDALLPPLEKSVYHVEGIPWHSCCPSWFRDHVLMFP